MPSPSMERAKQLYWQGYYDEARKVLWQILQTNPRDFEGWHWLFRIADSDEVRLFCRYYQCRFRPKLAKFANEHATLAAQMWTSLPAATSRVQGYPTHPMIPLDGATTLITAFFRDAAGGPIADDSPVSFQTDKGEINLSTPVTKGGIAQCLLMSANKSGKAIVMAQQGALSGRIEVEFTAGPPHRIQIESSSTEVSVGKGTTQITATVTDEHDNMVADGTNVDFRTQGATLQSTSVSTVDGKASTQLTAGPKAGVIEATASTGGISASAAVTLKPEAPHGINLVLEHDTVAVGGNQSRVTAEVKDEHGNPAADDRDVTFSVSPNAAATLTHTTAKTKDGKADTTLISRTTASSVEVSATVGPVRMSKQITLAPGPAHRVELNAYTSAIPVNGARWAVTASVTDEYGNKVDDNTKVIFRSTAGNLHPYPNLAPTMNGRAEAVILSEETEGSGTVEAEVNHHTDTVDVRFTGRSTQLCLSCKRLVADKTKSCPVCGTDNRNWSWHWLDNLQRFAPPFWAIVVLAVFITGALPLVAALAGIEAKIVNITCLSTGASLVLSAAVVIIVYAVRFRLREYEFLRQVKKRKWPGLWALSLATLGIGLILFLVQIVWLWRVVVTGDRSTWVVNRFDQQGVASPVYDSKTRFVDPALSPDGKTLLFASDSEGNWEIYAVHLPGSKAINLTHSDAQDAGPMWSEDGSMVIFASDRGKRWQLWTMRADGTDPHLLSPREMATVTAAASPDLTRTAFSVADRGFFDALEHREGLKRKIALAVNIFSVTAGPVLVLALMLAGVKMFTETLDTEFARPVFFDIDSLTKLALKSVHEHLRLREDADGQAVGPSRLPVGMDAQHLADVTTRVSDSVEKTFHISTNKKQPLVLNSVVGRRDGGLGFLFEQINDRRYYWVETDLDGNVSGIDGRPRVESLSIVSVDRTDSGGLKMVVTRKIEMEKKEEKTREVTFVTEDTRYEVETNEWGYIHSLQEKSDDKNKGLWAPTS
ncbi:MAG: PD40 domain-containing protein [Anaerolineae bacterium]|nr:PD40 domain-containing protein [Anaerolineae bacterium]